MVDWEAFLASLVAGRQVNMNLENFLVFLLSKSKGNASAYGKRSSIVVLKRAQKRGKSGGHGDVCVKSALLSYLKKGKPASI